MTTLSARIVTELCRVKPGAREALPGEWWNCEIFGHCPSCPLGGSESIYQSDVCGDCGEQLPLLPPRYIGPDLTLSKNLHHLFAVADAIACLGVDVSYNADAKNYYAHISGPDFECLGDGHGPTRTAALLAAVCDALGIEEVANG